MSRRQAEVCCNNAGGIIISSCGANATGVLLPGTSTWTWLPAGSSKSITGDIKIALDRGVAATQPMPPSGPPACSIFEINLLREPFYKLMITGSRSLSNERAQAAVFEALDYQHGQRPITTLVSGHAKGVDTLAELWAERRGVAVERYIPDWQRHGLQAGHKRNLQMLDVCNGTLAVWDGTSRGTQHALEEARTRGLLLRVVRLDAPTSDAKRLRTKPPPLLALTSGMNDGAEADPAASVHYKLCTPWVLDADGWHQSGRRWSAGDPQHGGGPFQYPLTIIPNALPPDLAVSIDYDYVPVASAERLVSLLDSMPVQAHMPGSTEHPATIPNAFGAMLSPHSPARMAFADDGRLTYMYGKPQGGRAYVTKPASWAAEVARPEAEAELCNLLRRMAEKLSDEQLNGTEWRFNYVLVQRYAGADTFLSFHRDSCLKRGSTAAGQVHGSPVTSVSLGALRVFAFTRDAYADKQPMYGLRLPHRCLVVMQQKCNDNYAHAILRGASEDDGVRYNLTFRVMQPASV